MSAEQNDEQDRSERRSELTGKDAVRSPETGLTPSIEEMDRSNHAVRSPKRGRNDFFENDHLNGE